jgi:hypothetical protein
MDADERSVAWRDRRRALDHAASEIAADVAPLARSLSGTFAQLAAQREASAELVPQRAEELLQEARDARALAEHERCEAERWAQLAEDGPAGGEDDGPSPGGRSRGSSRPVRRPDGS